MGKGIAITFHSTTSPMHHSARIDSAHTTGPRARLLVVDDEQLIRELYARVLSLEGYEVDTVENGATALERLAEEAFDAVLVDREMPVLDGESMTLALRSAGGRAPVIMISGKPDRLAPGVAAEISAILPKPARHAEVLSAVDRALHPEASKEGSRYLSSHTLAAA